MKVLITGGAGFIGSSVADALLEKQAEVLIIDNYKTGNKLNNANHSHLKIVEGSVSDKSLLQNIMSQFKPEVVLHAAASYNNPNDWEQDVDTNINGTIAVCNASKEHGVQKLIYLQTSLCYGLNPVQQPITLSHPLFSGQFNAGSSYALTKTAGEQFVTLSGINFLSLRLANVYGPRNLSGPLPKFYQHITQQKPCTIVNTKRDFIYIDDVVACIIKSVESKKTGYYHVATGNQYAIQEIFDCMVNELKPKQVEANLQTKASDDVSTLLLDASATFNDFDWMPKINIQEGIKRTVNWYKQNNITQTFTHLKSTF
jgi:UDP-glucose 4-epimerase